MKASRCKWRSLIGTRNETAACTGLSRGKVVLHRAHKKFMNLPHPTSAPTNEALHLWSSSMMCLTRLKAGDWHVLLPSSCISFNVCSQALAPDTNGKGIRILLEIMQRALLDSLGQVLVLF